MKVHIYQVLVLSMIVIAVSICFHLSTRSLKVDMTLQFISGSRKLIAQLNEEWNSNYFPELAEYNVLQSFDPFKFNCMKTFREELLFCVARGEKAKSELITSTILPNDANLVILNVSFIQDKSWPFLTALKILLLTGGWFSCFSRQILLNTVMSSLYPLIFIIPHSFWIWDH